MFDIDERVTTALWLTLLGAMGTTLGGLMIILHPGMTLYQLGILQGMAGGLMMAISFMDLLPDAVESLGFQQAHVAFYLGAVFFAIVAYMLPDPDLDAMLPKNASEIGDGASKTVRRQILLSGLITAVGIALHNFPEGVSVFLASMKSTDTGFNLAMAIAIHNIPEGVAVALPVYFATQSRWTGFKYAALSGLAEPLAVILVAIFLPVFTLLFFHDDDVRMKVCGVELSTNAVDFAVAGVGGIMAYITLQELLPLSLKHCGQTQMSIATFTGMALMSANLYLLHH